MSNERRKCPHCGSTIENIKIHEVSNSLTFKASKEPPTEPNASSKEKCKKCGNVYFFKVERKGGADDG